MDHQKASPAVQIGLVTDRCRLAYEGSSLPPWVGAEIRRRNLVTGNSGDLVSFCGFIAREGEVHAFLPRGTRLPESADARADLASLLAGCVERYARHGTATAIAGDLGDECFEGRGQLALVRELLEDYRLNGLYTTSTRQRTVNTGRTDWKRTMACVLPFDGQGDGPVYPVLYGSRNRFTADSVVARIHAAVVARLDRMFGWWITARPGGRVAPELADPAGLLERRDYCLSMLRRELALVYSDRNLRLIGNLIRYLAGEGNGAMSPVVIGMRDFHWAWEHMIGEVLLLTSDLGGKLPVPVYHDAAGHRIPVPRKGMKTDIIIEQPATNTAVVVDAKYYAASSVDDAPGWPDLVKQFFYVKALRAVRPDMAIGNAFVFPGTRGALFRATVESRDSVPVVYEDEFPPVRCIYADPVMVMRHYVAHTRSCALTGELLACVSLAGHPAVAPVTP
jgi:hypothetical protein